MGGGVNMAKKLILAATAALALAATFYWGVPMFSNNRISGKLIDAAYIPDGTAGGTMYILTDGSLSFFSKFKSAGKQVQGQKGIFCKTHLYWYDPVKKKVLARISTRFDQLPPPAVLLQAGDMLWELSIDPERPPRALAFGPHDGRLLIDTAQFYNRYAGDGVPVQRQTVRLFPPHFVTLNTMEDRSIVIDLESGKSAAEISDLLSGASGKINLFALADPSGGSRRSLWRISGGDWRLYAHAIPQSAFNDLLYFKRNFDAQAAAVAPSTQFLDGVLIYQDDDIAVILHQENMAPDADRRLTCVHKNGQIKWTLPQAQLFPGMALRRGKPFSSTFLIQSRLHIKKSGGVMLVVFQPQGWLGIEGDSGRELWRHTF
jgi:hypothetical protein